MSRTRLVIFILILIAPLFVGAQKADSIFDNTIALPSRYLSQVDNKIDKYYG